MKTQPTRVFIFIVGSLLLMYGLVMAQPEQTTAGNPPLEQPLIREGDLAMKLAEALKLGAAESEAEAESTLSSVDITPRNGWIADYPVTPDIAGELQDSVSEAADSGKITMAREAALKIFRDVMNGYDLSLKADTSGQVAGETTGQDYPDSTVENNYYYDEGPPVVTYYSPPPDYAYLYTWVPYPFWWSDVWFPGYFILGDFDVDVDRHRHGHGRDHDHDRDRDHRKRITNHFADTRTGKMSRIEPANRSHGGTFSDRAGAAGARSSAKSGAQAILNTSRGRAATGAYREFRGYGASGSPTGTRSSAFERSPNSQFERNSSDRGFQSRSNAGLTPGAGHGNAVTPQAPNSRLERNSNDRGFQGRSNAGLTPGARSGGAAIPRGGGVSGFHGGGRGIRR